MDGQTDGGSDEQEIIDLRAEWQNIVPTVDIQRGCATKVG